MKSSIYVIGYIATLLSTTGFLFKMQQWPGAGIMLVLGVASFNFVFLPMFFKRLYRRDLAE